MRAVGRRRARHSSSRCGTASRAGCTRTRPATARRRSPTARRRAGSRSQQGLNAVMEVFIVSFVTSTISALTILLTGAWLSGQTSTAAVALAFDAAMPGVGGWIVAVCVFLFGYTTLIGWAYYGEQFLEYIFGPRVVVPYRWIYCLLIPFGAIRGRGGLGVGRPDERAAGVPEHHRRARPERAGGRRRERPTRRPPQLTPPACLTGVHMHILHLTKPDGRPLVAVRAASRFPTALDAPSPNAQPVAPNSHLRWHPLRGEWVAYASHRQNRTFLPPPECNPLAPSTTIRRTRPKCRAGPWEVAVFENLFPTLTALAHDPPRRRSSRRGRAAAPARWSSSRRTDRVARRAAARAPRADRSRSGPTATRRSAPATTCSTCSRSRTAASRWASRCIIRTGRSTRIRSCRPSPRASSPSSGRYYDAHGRGLLEDHLRARARRRPRSASSTGRPRAGARAGVRALPVRGVDRAAPAGAVAGGTSTPPSARTSRAR